MNLAAQVDLLAGYKLQGRVVFQGIPVSIENKAGSVRSGVDPGGKPWKTRMVYDYGRIPRTRGMDAEAMDVFLGPHKDAENAYVITIRKPPDFTKDDEQKVMLGFDSPHQAKKAFLLNYDDPRFLGHLVAMPMSKFKEKALGNGMKPTKLAASFDSLAAPIGMGHMAPIPTFHPPSMRNPKRIPTDDPGETDDTYLDVTKRHERATEDLRSRIASRKGSDFKNLGMAIRSTSLPWGPASGDLGVLTASNRPLPRSRLWRRKLRERERQRQQAWREEIFGSGDVRAYGTTEGAVKGWDARGRGRHEVAQAPTRPLGPGETTEQAWRDPQTGQWDIGREAFHEDVINKMMEAKTPPVGRKPVAYVLGGGTASGKTTASRAILGSDPNIVRIDPDEIKLAIPEYEGLKQTDNQNAAYRVHEESSYMTKMAMAEAASRGLDLTYDSTTSGNGGPAMAKFLTANGYDVHAMFVDVPIPVARERAALRAASSNDPINKGRTVPDEVLVNAHRGSAAKFFELKNMPGLKSARMYDNTGEKPRLVYENVAGKETVHDPERFEQYRRKGLGEGD